MTAADEVKARIDQSIDLSEQSLTELLHFTESLDKLYGQLMNTYLGSQNVLGVASFHVVASAREHANSIQNLLNQVHGMLEQWREVP